MDSASFSSVNKLLGEVDNCAMNLHFSSGAIGSFCYSLTTVGDFPWDFKIIGEKGTMLIHDEEIKIIYNSGSIEKIKVEKDDGYTGEFANFYDHIINESPLDMTLDDAKQDLKILLEALYDAGMRSIKI